MHRHSTVCYVSYRTTLNMKCTIHSLEVMGSIRLNFGFIVLLSKSYLNQVDYHLHLITLLYLFYPSRLEEDLAARYSNSDLGMEDELKGSRRGSGLARRSFFRRKKHQRNNSKDSRDLSSISDASLTSDSVPFLDCK